MYFAFGIILSARTDLRNGIMERMFYYKYASYHAVTGFIVFCVFMFCAALTSFIFAPLQQLVFNEYTVPRQLVYLPHGVCVLATMLFGPKMLPVLFAGNAATHYLFAQENMLPIYANGWVLPALVATLCAFVTFEAFRFCGKNYYVTRNNCTHWREIVCVGVIAALVAAVGTAFLSISTFQDMNQMALLSYQTFGKITGWLILLFTAMILFRRGRLRASASDDPRSRR